MTATGNVHLSSAGVVATITLDQPQRRNAMTLQMWQELSRCLDEVADDLGLRVLVLRGAGEQFCSGMDITAVNAQIHPMHRLSVISRAVLKLHRLRLPTVARVDGIAVGAGANLALGCDIVIASDRARFSEIFIQRGLSVDCGGSWLLPRLVGLHRARELCMLGDVIDADEAARIGLLARVVAADGLDDAVAEVASRLAASAPIALQQMKLLLNEGAASSFEQAVEAEMRAQSMNLQGADSMEAFAAFREKRAPVYSGAAYRPQPPPEVKK